MMEAVREWLGAVTAAALLVAVTETLAPEGPLRRIAGFVGGLALLAVVLGPLAGADLSLEADLDGCVRAVEDQRAAFAAAAEEELAAGIAERTEAYILDKAAGLGLEVTVRVTTRTRDGVPVPDRAEITGPWSQALAEDMETTLGIPRERQVWTEHGS